MDLLPHQDKGARGNKGVLATRYDEIFEVVADFMSPPLVTVALQGDRVAEWSEAMEAELRSLWENEV